MKTHKLLTIALITLISFTCSLNAQSVKKSKLKFGGYGQKKFNDAEKKIFIEQFSINYQYIYAKTKKKKGGRQIGGGYLGDAKAALFLGLGDLNTSDLQKITDNVYADFAKKLTDAGYTVLSGDDFKDHDYYNGSETFTGGTMEEYYQGFISTAPTGVSFINKSKGAFNTTLSTSKKLDGVTVLRVNVMVPFAENGESQGSRALTKTFGGVAKLVAKPNLQIGTTTIQTKSKLGFDKFNTITTYFDVGFKKGLKYQAWHKVDPKKGILIEGVLPTKKYKAVKSANQDLDGTQVGNYKVFSIPSAELTKMQTIEFDTDAYNKGVKEAIDYFVSTSTDKFLSFIK